MDWLVDCPDCRERPRPGEGSEARIYRHDGLVLSDREDRRGPDPLSLSDGDEVFPRGPFLFCLVKGLCATGVAFTVLDPWDAKEPRRRLAPLNHQAVFLTS